MNMPKNLLCAADLVIYGNGCLYTRQTLGRLYSAIMDLELTTSLNKIDAMKVRRCGRLAICGIFGSDR